MYRLINLLFKIFVYPSYRRKYNIPRSFVFNGYFIRFNGAGSIEFGECCYVSFFSLLSCAESTKIVCGNNVSIGHNVKIYTSGSDTDSKLRTGGEKLEFGDVQIGDNVVIGANSFIAHGVVIGNNVIVGANSLVITSIPDNSVCIGVPARVIKKC